MKPDSAGVGHVQRITANHSEQLQCAASATHAIAIIIVVGKTITSWNAGAQRIFGYEAVEMIGRSLLGVFERAEDGVQMDEHKVDLATQAPAVLAERWYRHKSGELFLGIGTAVSIGCSDAGTSVWFIRDVTSVVMERLSIERRLQEQEQAVNAARDANAAKDQFLAMVSHELKQPLTELLLHAEQLEQLDAAAGTPAVSRIGRAVKSAVRRQVRIIDDLLELSRIRTGKLRLETMRVDIAALVQSACDMAVLKAPQMQVQLDVRYAGQRFCLIDPIRVEQMLSNLLGNAIKFSRGRGCIEVDVSVDTRDARISVSDHGCGIDAGFLPHVFSMFGQELPRHGSANAGLGIGLALVHELATAHGGRVEAHSQGVDCGAQFIVWLPLADAAPAEAGVPRHVDRAA